MTIVAIALGSNLGDRIANLNAAVRLLAGAGARIERSSGVWETPPIPADQPRYLNAVVSATTELEPLGLLDVLKRIEWQLGRRPERRWGPRPIDLDLLMHGSRPFASERLTIPHQRIAERGFVLAPLSEVWRDPLPIFGRTALALLEDADSAGLVRTGAALTGWR